MLIFVTTEKKYRELFSGGEAGRRAGQDVPRIVVRHKEISQLGPLFSGQPGGMAGSWLGGGWDSQPA